MGAAREFTEKRFGEIVQVRQRVVALAAAQVEILPNDPDRLQYLITTISPIDVTYSYRSPIVLGTGLLALGRGSTIRSTVEDDGDVTGWALFAISNNPGNLFVVEISRATNSPSGEG
jgi:hypothetical protein